MEHTPNCQKPSVFLPLYVFGRGPQALLRENNEGTQLELLLISSFFLFYLKCLNDQINGITKDCPKMTFT